MIYALKIRIIDLLKAEVDIKDNNHLKPLGNDVSIRTLSS